MKFLIFVLVSAAIQSNAADKSTDHQNKIKGHFVTFELVRSATEKTGYTKSEGETFCKDALTSRNSVTNLNSTIEGKLIHFSTLFYSDKPVANHSSDGAHTEVTTVTCYFP